MQIRILKYGTSVETLRTVSFGQNVRGLRINQIILESQYEITKFQNPKTQEEKDWIRDLFLAFHPKTASMVKLVNTTDLKSVG